MSTIEVAVAGRGIQVKQGYEKPSAGDVNTCAVSLAIESGGVWDSLPHKRVTFATRTASVTVDYAPTIAIPHEVMASPGALYLTLTGYDADGIEVARTHRMTYPIEVARAGADEGAEPTPATLDVVSRIDALAADLEEKRDTDYWRGAPGAPGEPGADGYSPTANVTKVGGTATITVTDKNGTTTATVSDGAPGSDAPATDVRIAGKSITADGAANIPLASSEVAGVVKTSTAYATSMNNGVIQIVPAGLAIIDGRTPGGGGVHGYRPIVPNTIDYAVKAALCDGKGASWTADEQSAARERMNAADADKVYIMQKQIENLQGIAATEETDTTEAYTKTVPTGAQKWASLDKVGGKTVVWNQLVMHGNDATKWIVSSNAPNVSHTASPNGMTIEVNAAGSSSEQFVIRARNGVEFKANHKYLFHADATSTTMYSRWNLLDNWNLVSVQNPTVSGIVDLIASANADTVAGYTSITFQPFNLNAVQQAGSTVTVKSIYCIDLTKMFGAGNEPSTVEEFRAMFPAEYYPYNPGELMSAEVVEVESKGKNLLDFSTANADRWNVRMIPNPFKAGETYTVSAKEQPAGNSRGFRFYLSRTGMETDKLLTNKYIGNQFSATETFTAPDDCGDYPYLNLAGSKNGVGLEYKSFNLMAERGSIATAYSPYGTKDTFTIPAEVRDLCPGYGWSAGTVCNEIDFERKVYVQRVGSVDLGTLTWTKYDVNQGTLFRSSEVQTALVASNENIKYNMTCAPYISTSSINCYDKTISRAKTNIRNFDIIDSSYTDAASFKAAMSGVMLYYELAEPVEIDLSDILPDDNFIEVEAGGTVTFKQASTQLPVPSSVTYQISTSEVIANA